LPSEWKTHTLIWRNKANLEEHSLDDLFNISAATSVFAVCAQLHVSFYPNIDSLSNAVIFSFFASQSTSPQLDTEDLKQIDKTGRNLGDNRVTTMGFDMSKVEFYNCHRKGHFARECRSSKDTRRTGAAKPQRRHASSDSESLSPNSLSDRSQPSGEYHVVPPPITWNFMPPKPDLVFHTASIAVETTHSAFTVQLSPAKPAQDISHATRPMAPIIEEWVSNSEDESEPNDPQIATPKPTSSKTNGSSKRKNRKTCFVCKGVDHLIKDCNFYAKPKTQPTPRSYAHRGYDKQYASSTKKYPKKHIVPAVVLTKSKPVSVTAVRQVSTAVPNVMVSRPRHVHSLNTRSNSTIIRHITRSHSSMTTNSSQKVTAAKASVVSVVKGKKGKWGNPQYALKDKGVIDSGCSRHMTGNMSYLSNFQKLNGGYVAFGGNHKGGKISGKGKIKTGKLDFEDVYFVKELKFNLFSVLKMCDKKNKVLFTDSECLVLSPDFKLPDKSQVMLRVPRENNMYNVNLKDIVPSGDLTCLFAKATIDESNLWHRRLGHVNFKTINKLVKGNLVRGLPTKVFENQNTCVACKKGTQHRASCKTKPVSYVN
nr:ribonuclease H-like domain-containing protein [Tanacetum cinerariifolium]